MGATRAIRALLPVVRPGLLRRISQRRISANNVRIVNNVNITNVYRNSRIDHAVTVVDQDGFGRGRPGTYFRGRDGEFSRASFVQGQLPADTRPREFTTWPTVRQRFDRRGKALADGSSAAGSPPRSIGFLSKISVVDWSRRLEEHSQAGIAHGRVSRRSYRSDWKCGHRMAAGRREPGRTSDRSVERGQDGWRRFGAPRLESQGESNPAQRSVPASSASPSEQSAGYRKLVAGGVSAKRRREAPKRLRGSVRGEGTGERNHAIGVGSAAAADKHPALIRALWVTATPRGADDWRRNIGPRGDAVP